MVRGQLGTTLLPGHWPKPAVMLHHGSPSMLASPHRKSLAPWQLWRCTAGGRRGRGMLHAGCMWLHWCGGAGSAHPSCLPPFPRRCLVLSCGLGCDPRGSCLPRLLRGGAGPAEAGRGGLPGRVCYFLWSMQTVPIKEQHVVSGSGSFFPSLSPPVPVLISWVPSLGCGGCGVRQAALSSCPGKPQWGVRESRTQLPTCPTHLWKVGWASLCREMGMVQSWAQALGIEDTKGTAPAPSSLS